MRNFFPGLEESIKKFSTKYSSAGVFYLYHLFGILFGVFGAGFFIFLFGDIITREGIGANGSIHLLHTQPIRRRDIYVSKYVVIVIATFLFLLGISILSLSLGTIFDRFGDWNYPVLIYGEEYTFHFMNMGTFLGKSVILFGMILLFCYSLLFLFSIAVRKSVIAIGLVLITIALGINMSGESTLSTIAHYIPFHYFSVSKVVSNELAVSMQNFNFSFSTGVVSLAVSSIGALLAAYLLTKVQSKFSV